MANTKQVLRYFIVSYWFTLDYQQSVAHGIGASAGMAAVEDVEFPNLLSLKKILKAAAKTEGLLYRTLTVMHIQELSAADYASFRKGSEFTGFDTGVAHG